MRKGRPWRSRLGLRSQTPQAGSSHNRTHRLRVPAARGLWPTCQQGWLLPRPLSLASHRVPDGALVRVLERRRAIRVCVCMHCVYLLSTHTYVNTLHVYLPQGGLAALLWRLTGQKIRSWRAGDLELRNCQQSWWKAFRPDAGGPDIQGEPMLPSESRTQENTASQLEGRQAGVVVHAHAALRSCSGLQWIGWGPHRRGQSV